MESRSQGHYITTLERSKGMYLCFKVICMYQLTYETSGSHLGSCFTVKLTNLHKRESGYCLLNEWHT